MKTLLCLITLFYCANSFAQSTTTTKQWPSITMVNDVVFKDSTYNRYNIGCGFLLKFNEDTFAISAKHILGVAHTQNMKTTNFENELKHWKMYPRDKKEQTLICKTLLNEDATDSTNFKYINRNWYSYNDFLAFKIAENNTQVKPVEFKKTAAKAGEHFYVPGWTYADTEGAQRIYEFEYVKTRGTMMLMKAIKAPANGGGLSGSPMLDSDGYVVGLISGSGRDEETNEGYKAMYDISGLKKFLQELE